MFGCAEKSEGTRAKMQTSSNRIMFGNLAKLNGNKNDKQLFKEAAHECPKHCP